MSRHRSLYYALCRVLQPATEAVCIEQQTIQPEPSTHGVANHVEAVQRSDVQQCAAPRQEGSSDGDQMIAWSVILGQKNIPIVNNNGIAKLTLKDDLSDGALTMVKLSVHHLR